ncbi:MAG: MBOAT family O-acyltransferase [Candidatus Sulfotelmatobacter sp.]
MVQSVCYVLLFVISVAVFATVRSRRGRQTFLLFVSFVLYLTWVPCFAGVLITSIVVNFLIGGWLRRNQSWAPLALGIAFNLGLLSMFKYLPELTIHIRINGLQSFSSLALPLGISFWTFQALSYLFDLYRGEELDPSLAEFALYMVFFPVTISGPVCRMPDMLPQFRSDETTPWNNVWLGFRRIAVGVLMMQFAKLLGQGILAGDGIVSGFDHVTQWSGTDVWCLSFGYGLQLFLDFAGYTHIAVGAARALGITVPENFERPFASTSPSVFWTRWHMSLSFWIRDYVFFPLAPLRREIWWRNLTLAFSMVVFGLWHKATLLFLIWGCYHGVLLVAHRQVQQLERKFNWEPTANLWTPLSWAATAALISLGWIFFRANSLTQAGQMLSAIFSPSSYASRFLSSSLYVLVAGLAAGYGLVSLIGDALESAALPESASSHSTWALLARWRWFWIPSLYFLALMFVLMITHGQEASAGQLMYRRF